MEMKRIIIICEGETEQEFCKKILSNYFSPQGIFLSAPKIKASHGGIVHWNNIKQQISNHLRTETDAYVTTFIDYYGIEDRHEFPSWQQLKDILDKYQRIQLIEQSMKADIDSTISNRFLPYIQLHEFEGLLFNNLDTFKFTIPPSELNIEELQSVLNTYNNPELINSGKDTSPSHRLSKIIKGYNKVVYGNILAENIGLTRIRSKCPHFNAWINQIENIN